MQTKYLCVLIHIWIKGEVGAIKPDKALQYFFTDCSKAVLLLWIIYVFFCLISWSYSLSIFVFAMPLCVSVYICFVVTCWERTDLLALVCGVYCEFVTFPLVSWVKCGTWLYHSWCLQPYLLCVCYTFVRVCLRNQMDWIFGMFMESWILWVSCPKGFTLTLQETQPKVFMIPWTLRNEFNFWNVHGIMNTSGLVPEGLHVTFARDPKYSWLHELSKKWIYYLYLHFILSVKYQFSIFI